MRLIDAHKLEEKLRFMNDDMSQACVSEFDIADATTVEAAPVVHGKWVEYMPILGAGDKQARCSECGLTPSGKTPYCPNCAAKMDL